MYVWYPKRLGAPKKNEFFFQFFKNIIQRKAAKEKGENNVLVCIISYWLHPEIQLGSFFQSMIQ
jgi:hypothetical protein